MLKARMESVDDVMVIRLSGKITISGGDEIFRQAVVLCVETGARNILLDLTNVSYIDSAGMGELVSGYKWVFADRKIPYKLLTSSSGRVTDLLKLTQVDQWLPVYTDEAAAIASFK